MTNEELITQLQKLQDGYAALIKAMAHAGAELALLAYMVNEESDDD